MGARKRLAAEERKEGKKHQYFAVLRNCPTSPRKMRLVADLIRGMEVSKALDVLKYSSKEASNRVEKLLLSAVANWQAKNEGVRLEGSDLYVKTIMVDSGRILKRFRPAPKGSANRIKKRSNHVTIYVDRKENVVEGKVN
ncbi:MAG: 50S ribosomal protein L22 [Bacteroidales bacterium]|jgi:large subunit ribosomal protein L22|nr:50S ribosomal protein L22 [Bacteroidales bacterium]